MRVASVVIAVVTLVVIGGILALVLFSNGEPATAPEVDRPAAGGVTEASAASRSFPTVEELERLEPSVSVRPPKVNPRTPETLSSEFVDSSDAAATELQPGDDPGGSGDAFGISRNSLVNKGSALWIAEPHVASNGDRVLVTWNHGAAFSSNAGRSFTFVGREELALAPGGYCCDQVVLYEPARDLWIWFVQGVIDARGHNVVRIGIAKGNDAFDRRRFTHYTYQAEGFASLLRRFQPGIDLSATFLDYPNIEYSDGHLFLTVNAYFRDVYASTIIMRIPLDELAAAGEVSSRYVVSAVDTARLVKGAGDTMYFAQHVDNTTLRIWRWADAELDPTSTDVAHSAYVFNEADYTCPREGAVSGNFCKRLRGTFVTNDDRVNSGWIAGDEIGFAWNANRAANRGLPYPFSMVVILDRDTLALKDEPHIWSSNHAYQYAALAPNERGDLGGVVIAGGGRHYWTCAALVRDDASGGSWEARILDVSEFDALADETGDYLGAVPSRPGANTWLGSCMTLHGGGHWSNVEVRLYRFGRVADLDE